MIIDQRQEICLKWKPENSTSPVTHCTARDVMLPFMEKHWRASDILVPYALGENFHRPSYPAHCDWLKMIPSLLFRVATLSKSSHLGSVPTRSFQRPCAFYTAVHRVQYTQLCKGRCERCALYTTCVCAHYPCGADYYSQAGGRKAKEREHDGDRVGTFVSCLLGARIVIMKSELHCGP